MAADKTKRNDTRRADSFGDQQHDGREGERTESRRSVDWSSLLPPDADTTEGTTHGRTE